jgi:hypothetical protein
MNFGGQFSGSISSVFMPATTAVGFIRFNGLFTNFAFADFLLDMVSSKGRGGGDPNDPWTHLQNRTALFAQDDFKLTPTVTLNLGVRWAYTSPLVEQDNRQTNFNLVTGEQTFASDGSLEDRALYNPYYKGWEPRLGAAWRLAERWVVRGGYGISQFMEGTGANLRLPLNPPFFFESAVNYDTTSGAGSLATGFQDSCLNDTIGERARMIESAAAVQSAVEWVRGVPADLVHVGTGRVRRTSCRSSRDAR